MAPKAQAAKVPMITPSSTNPKVTEIGDYIFRVCFIDPFQGYVMAKFARDNLKLTKVAVLQRPEERLLAGPGRRLRAQVHRDGREDRRRPRPTRKGDTDFRAQLTAIKQAKPEAIYVPGYYTDVGLIARQARELGIKVPLLGGDGWDSEKLFELGGSGDRGQLLLATTTRPTTRTRAIQKFIADYKAAYGAVPDALAALGYDAAKVAIDAIEARPAASTARRCATPSPQTKDFPGVTGNITLDDKRNAVKPAVVLAGRQDGKSKYVRRTDQPPDVATSSSTSSTGSPPGTIYALVALGYTMVYGVLKLINFAHGDVMMVGVVPRLRGRARSSGTSAQASLLGRAAHLPRRDGRLRAARLPHRAVRLPAAARQAAAHRADHRHRHLLRALLRLPARLRAAARRRARAPSRRSSARASGSIVGDRDGGHLELAGHLAWRIAIGADGGAAVPGLPDPLRPGDARGLLRPPGRGADGHPRRPGHRRAPSCSAARWRPARASSTPSRTPRVQPLMGLYWASRPSSPR